MRRLNSCCPACRWARVMRRRPSRPCGGQAGHKAASPQPRRGRHPEPAPHTRSAGRPDKRRTTLRAEHRTPPGPHTLAEVRAGDARCWQAPGGRLRSWSRPCTRRSNRQRQTCTHRRAHSLSALARCTTPTEAAQQARPCPPHARSHGRPRTLTVIRGQPGRHPDLH
jgi:hypothetical protein